jgi:cardiolipin synthase A/B
MESSFFLTIAIIAICLQSFLLFLFFFEPGLRYRIASSAPQELDSAEFRCVLESLLDTRLYHSSKIEVLTNGEEFYRAELDTIRSAQRSINLEAYIFQPGEVTERLLEALTERAQAGVQVNLVLDAVGSFTTFQNYFRPLQDSGGQVAWYHPFRWDTLARLNNRTHRVLIVIDGKQAFLGGAGFADQWLRGSPKNPPWRDTMFRVEGEIVTRLQAAFAENWLEAKGDILMGDQYFSLCAMPGRTPSLLGDVQLAIISSPSTGRSTRARILFQTLLASAQTSICLTTPYFLPDWSARKEMIRAIRERGVRIAILTPGKHSDQLLTRRSSRRLYGELLRAGAEIYEYQPAMLHAKVLIVDDTWSVVGSTNFDNRSFGLNDEVNLVVCGSKLAARLKKDFQNDLQSSRAISYSEWQQRPLLERAHEYLGWILERQQ